MQIKCESDLVKYLQRYKYIIIYGTGYVGTIVADRLLDANNGIDVYCYAVTEKSNSTNIYGLPVLKIEELTKYKEEAAVVIATFENFHKEIEHKLKSLGFNNFIAVNNELYIDLRKHGFNLLPDVIQYMKSFSGQIELLKKNMYSIMNQLQIEIENLKTVLNHKNSSCNDYDKSFFEQMNKTSAKAAEIILPYVLERLKPKNVIDFGCGTGVWLAQAKKTISEVLGIDGDYVDIESLMIDSSEFLAMNLENDIVLDRKFDLAMSLEVAEHIREENSDIYIRNTIEKCLDEIRQERLT